MIDKREIYMRVCRDSGHKIDPVGAAILTAMMVKCHPLEIWLALGWDYMVRIARGEQFRLAR